MMGYAAHLTSYSVGTAGPFSGVKWPRPKADHSPPPSTEVKNEWSYTCIPPVCLQGVCIDFFLPSFSSSSYVSQRSDVMFPFQPLDILSPSRSLPALSHTSFLYITLCS